MYLDKGSTANNGLSTVNDRQYTNPDTFFCMDNDVLVIYDRQDRPFDRQIVNNYLQRCKGN